MKIFLKLIFISVLFIFTQSAYAEEIKSYKVDIELQQDSSMTITETIDYNFGELKKHGIFRFIPINFNVIGQKELYGLKQRKLDFDILSVKKDGLSENYFLNEKDSNKNYFIKIGNEDETLTGVHQYEISYNVYGSLRYFDEYDEVYWNAIGLDWKIPINNIEVFLHSDYVSFDEISCYFGKVSSDISCDNISMNSDSIYFLQYILNPYEGLTIAASFKKDVVEKNELFGFTVMSFIIGGILILISFILGAFYFIRKYQRKYFVYDPIHPRYTPPEGFDAMFTGYLIDKRFDSRDISAGIIQLARDGYITIEKISKKSFLRDKDDYIFRLNSSINKRVDSVMDYRKYIINMLFIDSLITSDIKQMESKMSELSKSNIRLQYHSLLLAIKNDAVKRLLVEKINKKESALVLIPFIFTFVFFFMKKIIVGLILFFTTFFLGIVMSTMNSRYSKKGWETKHAIEGFKLFLEMTDKDRFEFFNNPADNPQEFMEYLPYAIALGVEEKWARQFKDITIMQPEWYRGAEPFVAGAFVSEINSFSKSITSSISKSTTHSSGSGSHGGGSSGGGSGGGGGGSW